MKQEEYPISFLSAPEEPTARMSSIVEGQSSPDKISLAELSGHFSHKLRNSLAVIVTASDQLSESSRTSILPEDRDLLEAIIGASSKLNGTINRFLQLVDPPRIRLEEININELCRVEADRALENLNLSSINYITDFEEPTLDWEIDPNLIRTLLSNLITNALQNMSANDQLSISTKRNGHQSTITISNSGPGIKPEILRSIFLPFYSTRPGQLGLGLSIAARIASDHGGTILAENDQTGNVNFIVTLPTPAKGRGF